MKEQIIQVIKDLQDALMENDLANQALVEVKVRKEKAYYTLMRAKEALKALESELNK